MKKLIFLVSLMFSTMFVFGQVDTTISNTERIIDKYGGKIVESFNSAVETLTPVAVEGFKLAVRLQIAKGIAGLLPLIVALFFIQVFCKEYNRIDKLLNQEVVPRSYNSRYGPMNEENITGKLVLSLIGSIIFSLVAIAVTYDAVLHLVAPEWYAIKEIIELF